ncbi:MAG: glycosyltransferase family 4 protein [Bacteroidota bacterium]
MRILILDTSPIRRGAQVFGYELAEHLRSLGHKIARVYLFQSNHREILSLSVQDRVLPFREESWLEKIPSIQPGILLDLKREIAEFQPEVILCNGSKTLKYGAWLRILNRAGHAKIIGRFIDDAEFWNPGGLKKWMYSFWINRLDGIVGVSQHSLDSVLNHYSYKKPNRVIHRTFDPQKFDHAPSRKEAREFLGLDEKEEVLLFLGNLTVQKRPDRFLEIVSNLIKTRPNLRALIVGDGLLREVLENQIAKKNQEPRDKKQEKESNSKESGVLNLASCVSFKGYHQDVAPYLAASDLLILTSDTEGLPGVVLEAAHFGVPTVATEVGGIKECLSDGESGFLIPDRSVDAFCKKIIFLLDHPEKRTQMGQNAKTFISQNFKMNQVAKQYLDFFSSLIHPNTHK